MNDKDESVRAEIMNAAQQLFKHYGWTKTTMEDIAKAAGKGKSTLYYYYKSKDQIFDAVVIREMEEVFRVTKDEVAKVETAEEKLRILSIVKFKMLSEKVNLFNLLRGDIEADLHHCMELHKRYETKEISLVRSIIRYGLENGEFSHFAPEDVDLVAFSIVCAFRGIEIGLLIENKFADFEGRMDVILNILMQGLRA